jgi:hypothetical protein
METEDIKSDPLDDALASLEVAIVAAQKAFVVKGMVIDPEISKAMGRILLWLRDRVAS